LEKPNRKRDRSTVLSFGVTTALFKDHQGRTRFGRNSLNHHAYLGLCCLGTMHS
jgi:hypothetical protein